MGMAVNARNDSSDKTIDAGSRDGYYSSGQRIVDSPKWVYDLDSANDENIKQLFVVAALTKESTAAAISMHERDGMGEWKQILSTPGFVGINGLCAGEDHVEGCGQTPMGIYKFNKAFGIADDPGCAIDYVKVDENTYWSGDDTEGMHYNELVDIKVYPDLNLEKSEHIIDYDYQYQYCLNINFNQDGEPGKGSAIFLHCFGPYKPYTGGCVALPENIMKQVMQKVDPDCIVVIGTIEELTGEFKRPGKY